MTFLRRDWLIHLMINFTANIVAVDDSDKDFIVVGFRV